MISGPNLSLSKASATSGGDKRFGNSAMAIASTSHTSERYTIWSKSSEVLVVKVVEVDEVAEELPSSLFFCNCPIMAKSSDKTNLSLRSASYRSNSRAGLWLRLEIKTDSLEPVTPSLERRAISFFTSVSKE